MWWVIGGAIWLIVIAVIILCFKGAKMVSEAFDEWDRTGQ